jgi:hypothetical protein
MARRASKFGLYLLSTLAGEKEMLASVSAGASFEMLANPEGATENKGRGEFSLWRQTIVLEETTLDSHGTLKNNAIFLACTDSYLILWVWPVRGRGVC